MDVRFLSSVIAVVEEGSLAAAARREGVTASALSQRVAALEAELKVSLFRRSGRVVQPTSDLRGLLPQMRQMVRLQAEMRAHLRDDTLCGRLRLGAISTAMGDYTGALLQGLNARAPDLALELVPGSSADLFAALGAEGAQVAQGTAGTEALDAAIIVRPPFELAKALVFEPLLTQQIGLLRPKAGAAALPYLIYARSSWGGAQCWRAFEALTCNSRKDQTRSPEVLAELDALEVIAQMVGDGVAQAVVPRWEGLSRLQGVTFEPLDGARDIGLLYHRRDHNSVLMRLLGEVLHAAV